MDSRSIIIWAYEELKTQEEGRLDAQILLSSLLNISLSQLKFENIPLTSQQIWQYEEMIFKRKSGQPVSHILGTQPFYRFDFYVNEDVLTPRFDSEVLIEAALSDFKDHNQSLKMADLGTGSGCLLLSFASEYKNVHSFGLDISEKALKTAKKNQEFLMEQGANFSEIHWILGSWEAIEAYGPFDVIFANPPYIAESERSELDFEVLQYDPHHALFAQNEGLQAYEDIFPLLKKILKPKGRAYIEHGHKQQEILMDLAQKTGLVAEKKIQDLSQNSRALVLEIGSKKSVPS